MNKRRSKAYTREHILRTALDINPTVDINNEAYCPELHFNEAMPPGCSNDIKNNNQELDISIRMLYVLTNFSLMFQ